MKSLPKMATIIETDLGGESGASPPPVASSPPPAAPSPPPAAPSPPPEAPSPTEAMRARAELNRQRARSLRAARVAAAAAAAGAPSARRALDTGGGFLLEEDEQAPGAPAPPTPRPAPRLDPAERPRCLDCGRGIALSYLLDTFQYAVCDDCRDAEGAHSLLTRTEAKAAFLLQDCDLDSRGAPLACVRRRNPHHSRGDMRLYLRAQVEARALEVWGDEARLRAELARREEARGRAEARRGARRLRALRLEARSSLLRAPRAAHQHAFGPETYDADADLYARACACGHTETYEKM